MPCSRIKVGEIQAIVCGRHKIRTCVKCGQIATRECDWKVMRSGRKATCDAPICDDCTHQPAKNKDLCPKHSEEWGQHSLNLSGK